MRTALRTPFVAFVLLLAACVEDTIPTSPSADRSPSAAQSLWRRTPSDKPVEAIGGWLAPNLRLAPQGGRVPIMLSADLAPACWDVTPKTFTLDITGQAYPSEGQMGLWCQAYGTYYSPYSAAWTSSTSHISVTQGSGYVTAVSEGSATICAFWDQESRCAGGTVLGAPVVTRVVVSPSTAQTVTGGTVQLSATVYDQYNIELHGGTITWSSSNSSVATVNSSGLVTGGSAGAVNISACTSGKCGSSQVSVNPPSVTVGPFCSLGCTITTPNTDKTFTASASGGNGSYTYQWRVYRPDGYVMELGTSSSQTVNFDCPHNGGNVVEVTVSSAGMSTTASKLQNTDFSGSCF